MNLATMSDTDRQLKQAENFTINKEDDGVVSPRDVTVACQQTDADLVDTDGRKSLEGSNEGTKLN